MSKIDVILIRPQEHDYEYLEWHEDIFLAYLMSSLKKKGYTCKLFDFALRPLLTEQDYKVAIEQIAQLNAPLIVFGIDKHPTNNPFYACKLIHKCRAYPELSETHFTVYGNTQIGVKRFLEELPINSVVTGEEQDFLVLTQTVGNSSTLDKVPGVMFKTSTGEIRTNPPLPLLKDLDELPLPKRYYFALPPEQRHNFGYVGGLLGSKGCYGRCKFCHMRAREKIYGSYPWRGRSPQKIVDEIELLYYTHNVRDFAFLDYQFFGPGRKGQQWAQAIAQEIIKREINDISFSIYARANDIKRNTISLLKKAGLYAVFIGIESFNQQVLDRYKKGTTVDENLQAIEILLGLDIRLRMGLISFDYFTTLDELRRNIIHLKNICKQKSHLITQPIFFQNILAPLDDTPIGDEYRKIGSSSKQGKYGFEQILNEQQRRSTRNGQITSFSDVRVAYLSEMTRMLASEILQRSTQLEIGMSQMLVNDSSQIPNNGSKIDATKVLTWFDNLTMFTVSRFEQLYTTMEKTSQPSPNIFENMAKKINKACQDYDFNHLGCTLNLNRSVRNRVFD